MIGGNIFKNWNKPCYIASKLNTQADAYGNEINVYAEPQPYSMNIQPANGDMATTVYGDKIFKVYKAVVPYDYKDLIKEGDIAYLDGATPENEVEGTYGSNGNYVVDSVRPQNLATTIYFMKLDK